MLWSIPFFFFALYLIFPTHNSTLDGFGYACEMKYAESLFRPHHLLYNITGHLVYELSKQLFSPLVLMKIINACFAGLSLLLLQKILAQLNVANIKVMAYCFLTASSFAVMRYATENETYIIPIFFSMLSGLYFVKFEKERLLQHGFYAGLFGSMACLYHQIHFFWWLGIALYFLSLIRNRPMAFFYYLLPAIIVPVVYILVLHFYLKEAITLDNLLYFVFEDFYKNRVTTSINFNNVLLTGVSFIRTFIQVHGYMFVLVKKNILFLLPLLLSAILGLYAMLSFFKNRVVLSKISFPLIFKIHSLIFILQLLFAFYAVGNAEFMVMLPFMLVLMLASIPGIPAKTITYLAAAFFTWNVSYALQPLHFYPITYNPALEAVLVKEHKSAFILQDKGLYENALYLSTGKIPGNLYSAPAYYKAKFKNTDSLQHIINDLLKNNTPVYTDCIGQHNLLNRAALLESEENQKFFERYIKSDSMEIEGFGDKKHLFLIK